MDNAHQGEVVDLVHHVLGRVARDGGLVFAGGQVGQLRVTDETFGELVDQRGGIDDLILGDARNRGAEDDTGNVAASLGGGQANAFKAAPDFRHILNADPVQLDVLAVRKVGRAAGEVHGNLADDAKLLGGQRTAVDAHAEHEVLVFELVRFKRCGLAAVDPGFALGVEAPPTETTVKVRAVDRIKALFGVDRLNPLTDVQPVVFLLPGFVGVQWSGAVNLPLAVGLGGRAGACRTRGDCGVRGRTGYSCICHTSTVGLASFRQQRSGNAKSPRETFRHEHASGLVRRTCFVQVHLALFPRE